jgi:hypothetical protein
LVPTPKGKVLTQSQVFKLVAALRRSEIEKAGCGQRVLGLYDTYAQEIVKLNGN